MIVSDVAIKNRISVVVFSIILILSGVYCYFSLPRENAPDITVPYVFVSTSYKGVSSTDMETAITIPIEKKLKGLDGVKKIESKSSEGNSSITIEFETNVDIDDALQKVKDKVDEAKNDLPSDLEDDPSVFEVNLSEEPIVIFSISGTCGITCLKKLADDLADDIEAIPGVLESNVTGGLEREIQIEVLPDKLSYYQIPITTFQSVVYGENQNTSGGSITLGDGRYQLRVPGEFESPDEIYSLVVSTFNGNPVYLKDVARVVDGFKEETSRSRLDGEDSINIAVKKRSGQNILGITDKVDGIVDRHQLKWPEGTKITKLMDQAKQVRMMVADLENNILTGLVLVVAVLLFAMGFRNALLVGTAIPFSMLLSFIILHVFGITLNMVVLFSLTLALGMLVDNAIVIVENIYRFMEQGVPRVRASMMATSEVAYPVIGSTLTTLVAFLPMIFWPGIMGEFMKWLPITLIITLSSSLFVALVINPSLAAFFMRVRHVNSAKLYYETLPTAEEKPVEITRGILKFYSQVLNISLRQPIVFLLISLSLLVLSFLLWLNFIGLVNPVEFFPQIDPDAVYVDMDIPQGADLAYIDRIVKQVEVAITQKEREKNFYAHNVTKEEYLNAYVFKEHTMTEERTYFGPGDLDNVEHIYSKSEESDSSGFGQSPTHIGIQFVDFADRKRSSNEDVEEIRKRVRHIPGAEITIKKPEEGPPTGSPINIEIAGDDFSILGQLAKRIKKILEKIPFVEDISDDYVEGIPAIRIKVDRQKAALFGLSTNSIGLALKTAYNGMNVSTYREGNEDYDITVILSQQERSVTDLLDKLVIPAPSGVQVPLTSLAAIGFSGTMGDITRVNHERVVTVKANVDESKKPGSVARMEAEKLLENFPLPAGYRIQFTGESEDQKESEEFLTRAFIIAVFLIFLVLVTMFNSVLQPAIIMSSVALSLGGVFLGLALFRAPFGIVMSGVGVISLAGVVVNNAIVLIDYMNKLRERGMALKQAVIAAGATRLRPVMLTAITTVLGLVPMVTGVSFDFRMMRISWASETTQWWKSMAIVVIFGLVFATFLTLVVVPTLYYSIDRLKLNMRNLKEIILRFFLRIQRKGI